MLIPRIERDLVRQRVLVMEYMKGVRIDRADGANALRGSGVRWVRSSDIVATVMELYIEMMLVDGLFHADPHPGNLLVAPDGRIILLDFGMVVPVPRETRWHLIRRCSRRFERMSMASSRDSTRSEYMRWRRW